MEFGRYEQEMRGFVEQNQKLGRDNIYISGMPMCCSLPAACMTMSAPCAKRNRSGESEATKPPYSCEQSNIPCNRQTHSSSTNHVFNYCATSRSFEGFAIACDLGHAG